MSDSPVTARLRELDGLRGVAALVVVIHHVLLTTNGTYGLAYAPGAHMIPGSVGAWIAETPLQLLASGQEAVLVFFVLSGLVVALPAIRSAESFHWGAYYPSRVVRLMLPTFASVIWAGALLFLALARAGWGGGGPYSPFDWRTVLTGLDVLGGAAQINLPLWSMRYELIFSLMLPIFVLLATLARRRWWIGAVASIAMVAFGWIVKAGSFQYLPLFFLGTLVCVHLDSIREWSRGRKPLTVHLLGGGALVLSLVLLDARWIFGQAARDSEGVLEAAEVIAGVGAAALVVVAIAWTPAARVLKTRVIQWLGRVSFSLYLTHLPVIWAVSSLLRDLPWWAQCGIAVPLTLAAAELFARFVEQPAHRLSQTIRRRIAHRDPAVPA